MEKNDYRPTRVDVTPAVAKLPGMGFDSGCSWRQPMFAKMAIGVIF
jgi:hypothetical protein